MRRNLWLVLPLLLLGAVPSLAQNPYFPLHQWMTWDYSDGGGGALHAAVVGKEVVRRKECTVMDWVETGHTPQHFKNYWTLGTLSPWVYLNASWNDDGYQIAYDPPIPWIPPVLILGDTWDASFDYYLDWNAETPDGQLTTQRGVLRQNTWQLIGGTFDGYLVTDYDKTALSPDGVHDLLGRRLDGNKDTGYLYWYSEGVGQIIREWYQLVAMPVGNEDRTWSDVKNLYR